MVDVSHEIISKAKSGDENAMNDVLTIYKNIIGNKAKHFFIIGAEKEDVFQEGMIGLLKAIKHYDKDKVASFKSFATLCIQRQVITAIKKANAQKHNLVNNAVSIDDDFLNSNEDPEEMFISKENAKSLEVFLNNNLSAFEQEVYKLMLKEFDYKEIAEKMNKEPKAVDNAIQRIRRKGSLWAENF